MSPVHISEHPLVKHKLTLLRDVTTTEHKKFRELIRELACCWAMRRPPTDAE